MSFKVGDEVELPRFDSQRDSFGKGLIVDIHNPDSRWPLYCVKFSSGAFWVRVVQLACPIARESAKLAAKVDQLEAEVNAWIERMRRGEF